MMLNIGALLYSGIMTYAGNSITKLQIQVGSYDFELSAGDCH
jgi:hypothetical protein